MKTHSYKEGLKKQVSTIAVGLFCLIGTGYQLYPVNTPYKVGVFSLIVATIGIGTFFYVRKFGYKQLCSQCKTDVFPFIDCGKQLSTDVKYCPSCGNKI